MCSPQDAVPHIPRLPDPPTPSSYHGQQLQKPGLSHHSNDSTLLLSKSLDGHLSEWETLWFQSQDPRKPPFRHKGAAAISGLWTLNPERLRRGLGSSLQIHPVKPAEVWRKGHVPAYSSIPTEQDSGPRAVQRGGRDRWSSVSRKTWTLGAGAGTF